MSKKYNPGADILRAKALATPTTESILDEIIEKDKENQVFAPKMLKVHEIIGRMQMLQIDGFIAAGFTREEAIQMWCARESRAK